MSTMRMGCLAGIFGTLCGCDSPSPAFADAPATRVTLDGATFSVRHTPFAAEAVRLGPARVIDRQRLVVLGGQAITMVSGCPLLPRTLNGDTNLVRAELDCDGSGPRPATMPPVLDLDCGVIPSLWRDRETWHSATVECAVIRID